MRKYRKTNRDGQKDKQRRTERQAETDRKTSRVGQRDKQRPTEGNKVTRE